MIKYSSYAIIPFLLLIVISCGKSESQVSREKAEALINRTEQLKNINAKTISDLSKKYNSISGWEFQ